MKILRPRRLYLPALSIVALVLTLFIFISISTYRNLSRDRRQALDILHQQGLVILRSLEAGARSGIMMHMRQQDAVGNLITETARDKDIVYIYIFNSSGTILHHSDFFYEQTPDIWKPEITEKTTVRYRIREMSDGSQVYELAKHFRPLSAISHGYIMKQHMRSEHFYPNSSIVVGLKMDTFEEARKQDFHHAIVMGGILVALGTGTLFFIFVIQNYYLVDRTLKKTRDYTRQVIASMANGLLSIEPDGKIVSYNLLALELLDLTESQVKGMNLKTLFDFQASGIHETLTACRAVLDREIQHTRKSGETIPLALSITPIPDEVNQTGGAVIILRDLREIKRLEEKVRRSEKLAAIGKLAAGVAHEIRNPLSSIRGFAQFLSHVLRDQPREQEYARIMVKEIDRINRVVTDLITFARPADAILAPTNLSELIAHVLRLTESDAQSQHTEIHQHISPDMTELLLDANQMTQAILNLMLNALQAVKTHGVIRISATIIQVSKNSEMLCIQVEDDGPGIPMEHQEKIFDPFFTTRQKGTGLGLAIVHKIVENHRGEIRVESPPQGKARGCCFVIHIPVEKC